MELRRFDSVAGFLAVAGEFLGAREAEHNLIFGLCAGLQAEADHARLSGTGVSDPPPYLAAVIDAGRVIGAALQTPPRNLVLSEMDDPAGLRPIAADLAGAALPGVAGPAPLAAAFAELWSGGTGMAYRLAMRERIFRLREVRPPRETTGTVVEATEADRPLIVEWLRAFVMEAFGEEVFDPAVAAERWLARRLRRLLFWVDGAERVSMAGVSGPTPNGIRIGPVYTPPECRGRGYASNLVAEAAQSELDAGRRFVFLFTDLANPTSNHIYQLIGFEPVSDVDHYAFD